MEPESLLNNPVDFLIVHLYTFEDLELLLLVASLGTEILLLKRYLVPPEHRELYERMYQKLKVAGVKLGEGMHRVSHIRRFLSGTFD